MPLFHDPSATLEMSDHTRSIVIRTGIFVEEETYKLYLVTDTIQILADKEFYERKGTWTIQSLKGKYIYIGEMWSDNPIPLAEIRKTFLEALTKKLTRDATDLVVLRNNIMAANEKEEQVFNL